MTGAPFTRLCAQGLQRRTRSSMADDAGRLNQVFAETSFLYGANAAFIEDLYEQYLVSPDSVDPKWKTYFDSFKGREAGDIPHSAVISHIADAAKSGLDALTEQVTQGHENRRPDHGRQCAVHRQDCRCRSLSPQDGELRAPSRPQP